MRLSTRDKWRLLGAALLSAGAELAGLALMATAAWLLLRAAERPPLAALTVAIVAVRVFALLRGGLRYAERLAGHDVVLRLTGALRARVYQALLPHRGARFSGGDLVTRLVSDVDALQDALLRCVLPAAVAAITGLAAVAVVATASLVAAGVLAAGLAGAGILLPWLAFRTEKPQARAELAERAVEIVTGRRELIAYGTLPRALDAAGAVIDHLAARERATATRIALLSAAGVLVQLATTAGVALLSHASVPWTAALTLGAMAAFEVVLPLIGAAQRIPEIRASGARVRAVLSERAPRPGTLTPHGSHLRLDGAGVRYPGRAPALRDVDLDLTPGKRVGILGPSGAGKTTLLHVLAGFVEQTSGRVTLDGRALDAYDPRRRPTVVSGALADAHVFHTSVRENLRLAKPGADDTELLAACETAGFDLPLERDCGPDGDGLSGGQRQRLVLARAVLADPPVLLLDEPVEGLDQAHGDAVLRAVLAAASGTVVLVTHRPEHVAGFDEVLTLEDGRVIASRGRPASAAGRRPALR